MYLCVTLARERICASTNNVDGEGGSVVYRIACNVSKVLGRVSSMEFFCCNFGLAIFVTASSWWSVLAVVCARALRLFLFARAVQ